MTLELLHVIRDYTLTRTSIPNHAGNIKDMKYVNVNVVSNLLVNHQMLVDIIKQPKHIIQSESQRLQHFTKTCRNSKDDKALQPEAVHCDTSYINITNLLTSHLLLCHTN